MENNDMLASDESVLIMSIINKYMTCYQILNVAGLATIVMSHQKGTVINL